MILILFIKEYSMKILLLSPLPPPVGGIASWTVNILQYYASNDKINSDIKIIHQNTAINFRNITKLTLLARVLSGIQGGLRNLIVFLYYLIKYKPDVIHLTSSGSLGLFKDILFVSIAKLLRIPLIIHFRFGRITEISLINNWEWKLLKKVVVLSKSVIVLDSDSLNTLSENNFKNIYLVPNPISKLVEQKMQSLSNENALNESYNNIVFVGHVTKNKGIFELAEAFTFLNSIHDLVIIGPYEKDVKVKITNLVGSKSNKLKFMGTLDKEQVLSEMKNAKVLVLPSYTEGFPNVLIEAMAMKCPVIATNVGAIASMLDIRSSKPGGLLVEPKDVIALIEALNFIFSKPDHVQIFTDNAFLKVKNEFTLKNVCHQYENIWMNSRK